VSGGNAWAFDLHGVLVLHGVLAAMDLWSAWVFGWHMGFWLAWFLVGHGFLDGHGFLVGHGGLVGHGYLAFFSEATILLSHFFFEPTSTMEHNDDDDGDNNNNDDDDDDYYCSLPVAVVEGKKRKFNPTIEQVC
jgi:hypothetical protein